MTRDILWWAIIIYFSITISACMDDLIREDRRVKRTAALIVIMWLAPMLLGVWFWAPWGQG